MVRGDSSKKKKYGGRGRRKGKRTPPTPANPVGHPKSSAPALKAPVELARDQMMSALGVVFAEYVLDFKDLSRCSAVCRLWSAVAHDRSVLESHLARLRRTKARAEVDLLRDPSAIWNFLTVLEMNTKMVDKGPREEIAIQASHFSEFAVVATREMRSMTVLQGKAKRLLEDATAGLKHRGIDLTLIVLAGNVPSQICLTIMAVVVVANLPEKLEFGVVKRVKFFRAIDHFDTPAFQVTKGTIWFPLPRNSESLASTISEANKDAGLFPRDLHRFDFNFYYDDVKQLLGIRRGESKVSYDGLISSSDARLEHCLLKLFANFAKVKDLIQDKVLKVEHSYKVDPITQTVTIPWNVSF